MDLVGTLKSGIASSDMIHDLRVLSSFMGLGTGKVLTTGALGKPPTSSELWEAAFLLGSALEAWHTS